MADYRQELEASLQASRKRLKEGKEMKALKASAPTLFQIIDSEISLELNRAFGDTPLTHDEYLASHGAVRGIRRIRNLIDAKEVGEVQASQEVAAIESTLKEIKNDQKQQ